MARERIGYRQAIAVTLAEEGCDVIAADIDAEGAEKTPAPVANCGRSSR